MGTEAWWALGVGFQSESERQPVDVTVVGGTAVWSEREVQLIKSF